MTAVSQHSDLDSHGEDRRLDQAEPTAARAYQVAGSWRALAPQFVFLATFVAFLPALQNEFVYWDDDKNFTQNPYFRGLGWTHLRWMLTTDHMGQWIPVSWITLGLDYLVWGMNPFGYHLTNVLLHAATASVLLLVGRRLIRSASPDADECAVLLGAATAALFFAVHPLRVESVAWATERRDVLSGLLFVLTVLAYLKGAQDPARRRRWLAVAVACYALAAGAKALVMGLPLMLLVLDVYPLRRVRWQGARASLRSGRGVLVEKIPFVVLAVGAATMALVAQRDFATPLDRWSAGDRIAVTLHGTGFYLWKTVAPLPLLPLWELPPRVSIDATPEIASALAFAVVLAVAIVLRRRWPGLLVAGLWYVVFLAPVVGVTQSGPQIVAARYSYLPSLGWAVLLGAGVSWMAQRAFHGRRWLAVSWLGLAVSAAAIALLAALTWHQCGVWRDSETLWRHALAHQPESSIAHNNVGVALVGEKRFAEAEGFIRRALELRPDYEHAMASLADALELQQRDQEAADARAQLGYLYIRLGKLDEALTTFERAVRTWPDNAVAHNNLGVVLLLRGDSRAAGEFFEQALRLDPELEEARVNLERLPGRS